MKINCTLSQYTKLRRMIILPLQNKIIRYQRDLRKPSENSVDNSQ